MWEIRNVNLPDGQRACVQIERDKIVGITAEPRCVVYVDGNGYQLFPGFIDSHIHDRTSGYPEFDQPDIETVDSIVRGALAGGVTTVVAMPNPRRPTTTIEALERKISLLKGLAITYKLFFAATDDNDREIAQLVHYLEWVLGVKMYMEETTGNILVRKRENQRKAMIAAMLAGLPTLAHVGNQDMLERNRAALGNPVLTDHCRIRHPAVELSGTEIALQLQEEVGCPLHICHATLYDALVGVDRARQAGRPVTAEACVQHLVRHNGYLQGERGPFFKVNPPLRSPEDMRLLAEGVLQQQLADTIATDHAGHGWEAKMCGVYDKTPSGMTGVQTFFHIMFGFHLQGTISLETLIELTSAGPARLFGLNKGRIAVGADADLIIVDPDGEVEILDETMIAPSRWTPYHRIKYRGEIMAVVAMGQIHNSKLSTRNA